MHLNHSGPGLSQLDVVGQVDEFHRVLSPGRHPPDVERDPQARDGRAHGSHGGHAAEDRRRRGLDAEVGP